MYTKVISTTPTIGTAIYASGDIVGACNTIPNALNTTGGSGKLLSIVVVDKDDEGAALDIHFFERAITPTSADNAPVDITDADAAFYLGKVAIATGDYEDLNGNKCATKTGLAIPLKSSTRDIYYIIVSKGTPTYTAATDLIIKFGLELP